MNLSLTAQLPEWKQHIHCLQFQFFHVSRCYFFLHLQNCYATSRCHKMKKFRSVS